MYKHLKDIQKSTHIVQYFSLQKTGSFIRLIISYLISMLGIEFTRNRMPFFISVEITNYCNLHCPECPVGINEIPAAKRHDFEISLYKSLIDQLKPTLAHVILYFQGEPFLNSKLAEFIKIAHQAKIYTTTSTNGQLFHKKNVNEIVSSGLDKIIVSIDGASQEVYEMYRVGGNLNRTLQGIKELVAAKKELKSATPFIEIQFLVLKTNEHQMKEMKKLAKSLDIDRLTFKTAQLYDFKNGNDLMPTKNKYSRYKKSKDGKFRLKGNLPNRCWRMWSGAVVNVNGEVLPCCFDKKSENSFGNIYENSFSECWHSKKASNFREKILQNRKQFEMCRNCTS